MALVMAMGERTKELDLGRQQELADLAPMWRLGLDGSISSRHDSDVQALQVEKCHREVEAKGQLLGSMGAVNLRNIRTPSLYCYPMPFQARQVFYHVNHFCGSDGIIEV